MGFSFDPLGFVGGLFDTIFNQNAADRRTQQQRDDAMFFAQNRLQMTVQDGAKAGLSPLASIGASANLMPATLAGAPQSNMAGAMHSQVDTGRDDPLEEKVKNLQIKLLESQIASTNADTIGKTVASSSVALANQPGSPVPLPRPRSDVLKPLYQTYDDGRGGILESFSPEASQSFQNWGSLPAQIGAAAGLAGRNIEQFWRYWNNPNRSGITTSRPRMKFRGRRSVPNPGYGPLP